MKSSPVVFVGGESGEVYLIEEIDESLYEEEFSLICLSLLEPKIGHYARSPVIFYTEYGNNVQMINRETGKVLAYYKSHDDDGYVESSNWVHSQLTDEFEKQKYGLP